jgi:hypothetical protein
MRAFPLSRRSRSAGMATQLDGPQDIPQKHISELAQTQQ